MPGGITEQPYSWGNLKFEIEISHSWVDVLIFFNVLSFGDGRFGGGSDKHKILCKSRKRSDGDPAMIRQAFWASMKSPNSQNSENRKDK
jgi:hypothetical protein